MSNPYSPTHIRSVQYCKRCGKTLGEKSYVGERFCANPCEPVDKITRNCFVCKKEFTTSYKDKKCCSPTCGRVAAKEGQRMDKDAAKREKKFVPRQLEVPYQAFYDVAGFECKVLVRTVKYMLDGEHRVGVSVGLSKTIVEMPAIGLFNLRTRKQI